jgi:hypothetical protein
VGVRLSRCGLLFERNKMISTNCLTPYTEKLIAITTLQLSNTEIKEHMLHMIWEWIKLGQITFDQFVSLFDWVKETLVVEIEE